MKAILLSIVVSAVALYLLGSFLLIKKYCAIIKELQRAINFRARKGIDN